MRTTSDRAPFRPNGTDFFGRRNHTIIVSLVIVPFPVIQRPALDQLAPTNSNHAKLETVHGSVDDVVDMSDRTAVRPHQLEPRVRLFQGLPRSQPRHQVHQRADRLVHRISTSLSLLPAVTPAVGCLLWSDHYSGNSERSNVHNSPLAAPFELECSCRARQDRQRCPSHGQPRPLGPVHARRAVAESDLTATR